MVAADRSQPLGHPAEGDRAAGRATQQPGWGTIGKIKLALEGGGWHPWDISGRRGEQKGPQFASGGSARRGKAS